MQATVELATEHNVYCNRLAMGPPLRIAYEDVRLLPKGRLARELMVNETRDKMEEHGERRADGRQTEEAVLSKKPSTEIKQPEEAGTLNTL